MKKRYIFIILLFAVALLTLIFFINRNSLEKLKYDDKTYYLLEYKKDIFTYNFISNQYFEVDKISKINNCKWDAVYSEEDIFIEKSDIKDATKYYSDDENYKWYITIDENDDEIQNSIKLTDKEINLIYDLDNEKKERTIVFDDIKKMGSIKKISNDGFVYGIISLGMDSNNNWFYRTETIDDSNAEYIIYLPKSINDKINYIKNSN